MEIQVLSEDGRVRIS